MNGETNQSHRRSKKQLNNNLEIQVYILIIAQPDVIYLTMISTHKRNGK